MSDEKEKWIDEVIHSMQGSQSAKPRSELLAKIQEQVAASDARVIPISHWKMYAAAAVFIILMNTAALILYNRNDKLPIREGEATRLYHEPITISFQIYKQ